MLKSLFKPKWQSKSVAKRHAALESLNSNQEEDLKIIKSLIENDEDADIREAGLKKLNNINKIYQYSKNHLHENTKATARQIFLERIGQKSTLNLASLKQLIAAFPETKTTLLQTCPQAELRLDLLRELSEVEQAAVIGNINYADTRKFIANNLKSEIALITARQKIKGKDKSAEKILKAKLDALHLQQKQDKENLALVQKLTDTIESLAAKDYWHQDIKNQFLLTEKRWQGIDFPIEEAAREQFEKSYKIVKRTIDKHAFEKVQIESQKELVESLELQCHQLAPLSLQDVLTQISDAAEKLASQNKHWIDLSESLPATALLNQRYSRAQSAIESVIKASKNYPSLLELNKPQQLKQLSDQLQTRLKSLNWPSSYPPLQLKQDIETELEALISKSNKVKDQQQASLDKLHKRINRLMGTNERGNVQLALRELEAVTKQTEKYSGKEKAALDKRIEKATKAVGKMRDWKNFATEPKFIELCEQMESLSDSKKKPEALAQTIKKLQEQWKGLGHSEISDNHWVRFKAAGDVAYAPCAIFFSERKAKREKNLAARELILSQQSQLLEKTDWETLKDYKPIESELRSSMNAWQKIKDIEVKAGNKQWKRFNIIRDKLYAKLDTEYESNAAVKDELIKKVSALLEQDFSESKNESHLKKLQYIQKTWKEVGITRRSTDQKLWKTFKKTSDEVYAKIQGVRKNKRAEEDAQLNAYRSISKQIQSLAKTAKDLSSADTQFETLKNDYAALPPLPQQLPEKLLEGIAKDYQHACDAYQKAHEKIIQSSKNEAWDVLAQKAELCSQLEALTEIGNVDDEKIKKLQIELDALVLSDTELNRQFNKRLESSNLKDRAEYSERRRRLCIDLEILLGKDSPAEDKNLRRQMQLERMQNNGLGGSADDTATQLKQIKLDWYCLPSAEANTQAELDIRFKRLIKT